VGVVSVLHRPSISKRLRCCKIVAKMQSSMGHEAAQQILIYLVRDNVSLSGILQDFLRLPSLLRLGVLGKIAALVDEVPPQITMSQRMAGLFLLRATAPNLEQNLFKSFLVAVATSKHRPPGERLFVNKLLDPGELQKVVPLWCCGVGRFGLFSLSWGVSVDRTFVMGFCYGVQYA
jgi:hypothetical protein